MIIALSILGYVLVSVGIETWAQVSGYRDRTDHGEPLTFAVIFWPFAGVIAAFVLMGMGAKLLFNKIARTYQKKVIFPMKAKRDKRVWEAANEKALREGARIANRGR